MLRDRWFRRVRVKEIMNTELINLELAAQYFQDQVKMSFQNLTRKDISSGRISSGRGVTRRAGRGKRRKYHVTSAPGETPAVDSGRLKGSITHNLWRLGQTMLVARVGTNVKYARRLEYGFTGVDSLGRRINQKPRPFMFVTYRRSLKMIQSILAGGRL